MSKTTVEKIDMQRALELDSMRCLSGVPAVLDCVAAAFAAHRIAAEERGKEAALIRKLKGE